MPVETEYWFCSGSSDGTLAELRKLMQIRTGSLCFFHGICKEAGLYAGLQVATGDYVVVMD